MAPVRIDENGTPRARNIPTAKMVTGGNCVVTFLGAKNP